MEYTRKETHVSMKCPVMPLISFVKQMSLWLKAV